MVFSMRWKLLMATAGALTFALGACGDDEKKETSNENVEPGGGDAGFFGGIGALLDGGVFAELDDNVAGSACTQSSECGGKNATCTAATPEATGACTGLCETDDQCGAGGKCVHVLNLGTNSASFCAKICDSDSECDSKLQCRKGIDVTEILSGITEFLDGGIEGVNAEETPKICQEKADTVQLANGAVGKACTAETEASACGGGYCETLLNPGGYCTGNCLSDSDCGNGGGCARDALSATLGVQGSCRVKCTSDSDCRADEDYTCQEVPLLFGPGKYCAAMLQIPDGGFFPLPDAGAGVRTDAATAPAPAADASDESDAGT